MALSTASAIRDRVRAVIALVDPVNLTGTRFRDSRSELKGDFRVWAEANPAGCLRRYQVRDTGDADLPVVSNTDMESRIVEFEILLAYPQTNRAGADNALDRDDVIDEDWREINFNVGLCGRGNFFQTHDCTPLGATKEIERGDVVDFLVIRARYEFIQDLSTAGSLVDPGP